MINNKQWAGRVYREEVGDEGAAEGGTEVTTEATPETPVESVERPDWLQSKYIVGGKTQDESIAEQAKAYNELSAKFGSFTGAPESYEASFSDELKEAGIELAEDDPMIEAAMEFAKDAGMNQEGFNKMLNLYGMHQLANSKAQQEADEAHVAEQMKLLGPSAEARIQNISDWVNKHLDAEGIEGIKSMTTTAESVKAVERIISMTRGASVDVDNSASNSGASADDVRAMQFEKDQHGNRRISTDPDFRARYHKLRNEVYGTEDHKQIIGG